jgi:hypothetical protein
MKGVTLKESSNQQTLIAGIDPLTFEGSFDIQSFSEFIKQSEYNHYTLSSEKLISLGQSLALALSEDKLDPIEHTIGTKQNTEIEISISGDEMSASISLESSLNEVLPTLKDVLAKLHLQGISRGISTKRIQKIIHETREAKAGTRHSSKVAKGLPPKNGKNSYIQPVVPNALDRVLAPQKITKNKVDMRDLGAIFCVDVGQRVAYRAAPGKGRIGYTVTNKEIKATAGEWKDIQLGSNTKISDSNENHIIALVVGQPKFKDNCMSIDDTFMSDGVNVGTGNINYCGAVVVNGDVTENMEISAVGDVTINGFVESALIRSGGDIIITKGAMGKMNVEDCRLIANGSIFVQHAQGLDIVAEKDVNIEKQLAYSRVKCRGNVIVGALENPMGNLFASTISCHKSVRAGSIGSISGSMLSIDFSDGYNVLSDRLDVLANLLKAVSQSNSDNESRVSAFKSQHIPDQIKQKLNMLNDEIESQRVLLQWLRSALEELRAKTFAYEKNARVLANKELFPGVSVKLNSKLWKATKECQRCRIVIAKGNWKYDPII